MHKDKKFFCDVCSYGTNVNNSFKKHLKTLKHTQNLRESSVKMHIKKYKPENININICADEEIVNKNDKSMVFLEKITNELTQLQQENMLLKLNKQSNNMFPVKLNNFTSIFDDDFSSLFE